jgi:Phosphotransferase enzyme family
MNDLASSAERTIESLAARLTRAAGRREPIAVSPIVGGGNNRVVHLTMDDGADLILKSYFVSPHDRRDRLGAEWDFLTYAWNRGTRNIPQPLAFDRAAASALYRFIGGRKPAPAEIGAAAVEAAADFVLKVNALPLAIRSLRDASEACFSVAKHLSMVDQRIARLATLDPGSPRRAEADRFVAQRLRPAWREVRERIAVQMAKLGVASEAPLRSADVCLSPSDFGFHNALFDDQGRIAFIDFEYAGRDDPAKLVCDFFCQPELPVSTVHYESFADRIFAGLGLSAPHPARCRALVDAYRIKWVCIILNDFLPIGAARRAFADSGARAERCASQLAKADEKLAQLSVA